MPKFYAVEVRTIAIVQVEDNENYIDAEMVAEGEVSDIISDAKYNSIDFDSLGEIKTLKDLVPHGWDGKCLPYNGDGNTRLEDLLPAE
jgi:hypothetical protein